MLFTSNYTENVPLTNYCAKFTSLLDYSANVELILMLDLKLSFLNVVKRLEAGELSSFSKTKF